MTTQVVGVDQRMSLPTRTQKMVTKVLLLFGSAIAAFVGLGWAGLQVQPNALPAVPPSSIPPKTVPLPANLPAPVARFYRRTYGNQIPVIQTAVISGRGTMRPFGLTFPARYRFMHEAERNFRSYFELTFFGLPIMQVNEHYVDGKFRQEGTPAGIEENEPKNDHSANMRMWAEWVLWLPAALLTDPQVEWRPIDDDTALLVVPFGDEKDHLVIRFDPETGQPQYVEGMKYKHATDTAKALWINAVWFGDKPWADFKIEEILINAEVDTSFTTKGPNPSR